MAIGLIRFMSILMLIIRLNNFTLLNFQPAGWRAVSLRICILQLVLQQFQLVGPGLFGGFGIERFHVIP